MQDYITSVLEKARQLSTVDVSPFLPCHKCTCLLNLEVLTIFIVEVAWV